MCQLCIDAVKKHYPQLTDIRDIGNLLMSATAFPFGGPELIEQQLFEAKQHTDGSPEGAIAYAHQKLDEAMGL